MSPQARRRGRSWAAEPWIMAAMVVMLAWIGVQSRSMAPAGDAGSPDRRSEDPASREREAPAAGARPPRLVESSGPTLAPPHSPDEPELATLVDTDIAELRRRDLSVPVQGVLASSLVGSFNRGRNGREHEAIDILAARGTPALAVEPGRVAKLFTSERGGLTLYLFDESETYCYYYAHLDAYAQGLDEGDEVEQGDIVGYVGTTGNAPADVPHLHFAVFKLEDAKRWWEGAPLDPYLVWR